MTRSQRAFLTIKLRRRRARRDRRNLDARRRSARPVTFALDDIAGRRGPHVLESARASHPTRSPAWRRTALRRPETMETKFRAADRVQNGSTPNAVGPKARCTIRFGQKPNFDMKRLILNVTTSSRLLTKIPTMSASRTTARAESAGRWHPATSTGARHGPEAPAVAGLSATPIRDPRGGPSSTT